MGLTTIRIQPLCFENRMKFSWLLTLDIERAITFLAEKYNVTVPKIVIKPIKMPVPESDACYDPEKKVIYFEDNRSAKDIWTVVHEFIHHVQWERAKKKFHDIPKYEIQSILRGNKKRHRDRNNEIQADKIANTFYFSVKCLENIIC